MRVFPFPDKVLSREELTRDLQYEKIPPQDRVSIADKAWDTGVRAAMETLERHGMEKSILQIAERSGLTIERVHKDQIVGRARFFSEYYSREGKIVLYTGSIEKWADENQLSLSEAEDLILSHEFYHFLEVHELGYTAKQYQVPTLKIGRWVLLRSGLLSLSEIGAHGFSRKFYEIKTSKTAKSVNAPIVNQALNIGDLSALMSVRASRKE